MLDGDDALRRAAVLSLRVMRRAGFGGSGCNSSSCDMTPSWDNFP